MLAPLRKNKVEDRSIVGNYVLLSGTYLLSRHKYNIPEEL